MAENNKQPLQNYINDINKGKKRVLNELIDDCKSHNELTVDLTKEPDWGSIDDLKQAYIVAAIEKLCVLFETQKPMWLFNEKYTLKNPYFAANAKGFLRLVLMLESPVEFKSRNLFVSENVIERV